MTELDDFYKRMASEYEDLTVKLSVQVDSIVFSIRSIDRLFPQLEISALETADEAHISNDSSKAGIIHYELRNLIDALSSLKETVRVNLDSVLTSTDVALSENPDESSTSDDKKDMPFHPETLQYKATLARCINVLEELDDDLFNAEIVLVNKINAGEL